MDIEELKARAAAIGRPIEEANGLAYRPTGATLGAIVSAVGEERVELAAASLERADPKGEFVAGVTVIWTATLVIRADLERAWVPVGPRGAEGAAVVQVASRRSLRSVRVELPEEAEGFGSRGSTLADALAVPWGASLVIDYEPFSSPITLKRSNMRGDVAEELLAVLTADLRI